jgi:hypothetical protein
MRSGLLLIAPGVVPRLVVRDIDGDTRINVMVRMPATAVRLLCYAALVLTAFAIFFHFVDAKLSPIARGVFILVLLVGLVVLIFIPLAFPRLGFYRSDSLKKVNEAMAREESESDGSR